MRLRLNAVVLSLMLLAGTCISAGVSAAETVTIALWSIGKPIVSDDLIDRFEAANPGVNVELVEVPSGQVYDAWVKVLTAAGTPPDIFAIGDWNIQEYIDLGLISPVDLQAAGFASLDEVKSEYLPGSLDSFIVNSSLYGLPQEWNTILNYYNQAIFREVGLAEPSFDDPLTPEEFVAAAERTTVFDSEGRTERAGFNSTWNHGLLSTFEFNAHVRSRGGTFFDEGGQLAFNTPAVRDAYEFLYSLAHEHRVTPSPGSSPNFATETLAMNFNGAFMVRNFLAQDVEFDVIPWQTGPELVVPTYAWTWVIGAQSRNQDLASRFMRFALVDNSEYFAEYASFIHPRRDAMTYDVYQETPQLARFVEAYRYALYSEQAPNYGPFSEGMRDLVMKAVGPEPMTFQQALGDVVPRIQSALASK